MKSSKIKILVNAIPLSKPKTGIGRYIYELYREMEKKYKNEIEFFYFNGVTALPSLPSSSKNKKHRNKLLRLYWDLPLPISLAIRMLMHFKTERNFKKVIKDFDVYHETSFFPFITPSNVTTLYTIHDLSLIQHPQWHPKERVAYFNCFFKKRLPNVDHVLTVSNFSKLEIQRLTNIDEDKITVTHLGYDKNKFCIANEKSIKKTTNFFNIPEKYFLFVGTNDPRKNIDLAANAVKSINLGIPLVIAGSNGWGDALSQDIKHINYVSDNELRTLYGGAIALIFPSNYEGFGLPLLEAMACGCPVITNDNSSLPEVAGSAACYIDEEDALSSLKNILRRFITEKNFRKNKQLDALERAKHFSWSETADLTYYAMMQAFLKKRKQCP